MGSECFSILRFPVSPNFFKKAPNSKNDFAFGIAGQKSPKAVPLRLDKSSSPFRFSSPNYLSRFDTEYVPFVNNQFDFLNDQEKRSNDKSIINQEYSKIPFSPLFPLPQFVASCGRSELPSQIFTQFKMIFNALKTQNSPVDRSFIMQQNILGRNSQSSKKVLSISLKRLNSFYKITRYDSEGAKLSKPSFKENIVKCNKRIKRFKRTENKFSSRLSQEINVESKSSKCNCKNSECIKDYCMCYSHGATCGPFCKCIGCKNTEAEKSESRQVVSNSGSVRPIQSNGSTCDALHKPKIDLESHDIFSKPNQNTIKCNCKKSMCAKNYCECFASGMMCNSNCNCLQCSNKTVNV